MAMYRIKQFVWSLFSKVTNEDIIYVRSLLNEKEYELFERLTMSEQKHSIKVSKCVKENVQIHLVDDRYKLIDITMFMRLALLHDIGKIERHLTIIDKSLLVILNKLSKGQLKKLNRFNKINIYYNHGKIGAEILKNYGYSERFLYLIQNHHEDSDNDLELIILKKCDDMN